MKVKNILNKFNKYIEKNTKNINWQTRYNNLNKKYEEALKEIDNLKEQLDNDRNVNLIKEKNKYIKTLQKQLKQDTINPHQYIHTKKTLQNIKERTGTITQDQYQIQANKLGIPVTQLKQLLKEDKQTQRRQETQ